MKKAFTLIEVIILLVIFTMVAILVVPLSIDDTIHAKHIAKWKQASKGFSNIPTAMQMNSKNVTVDDFVFALKNSHSINKAISYKIKYMNGEEPQKIYVINEIFNTENKASIGYTWYDVPILDKKNNKEILGILMYDVNGKKSPNVWGKDVFGFNIYKDNLLPLGSDMSKEDAEFDCSRQGTGLSCSSYYLKGGLF